MTAPGYGAAGYRAQAVTTAGPAQLVLMLFDGALTAIEKARRALTDTELTDRAGAGVTVHVELTRAQDIVLELQMSLDHEVGGAISASLDSLYGYCLDQLVAANLAKSSEPLTPVAHIIREIRDAWAGAMTQAGAA